MRCLALSVLPSAPGNAGCSATSPGGLGRFEDRWECGLDLGKGYFHIALQWNQYTGSTKDTHRTNKAVGVTTLQWSIRYAHARPWIWFPAKQNKTKNMSMLRACGIRMGVTSAVFPLSGRGSLQSVSHCAAWGSQQESRAPDVQLLNWWVEQLPQPTLRVWESPFSAHCQYIAQLLLWYFSFIGTWST